MGLAGLCTLPICRPEATSSLSCEARLDEGNEAGDVEEDEGEEDSVGQLIEKARLSTRGCREKDLVERGRKVGIV